MSLLEDIETPKQQRQRWNIVFIIVAISLLTVSLGTRTRTAAISHGITAQSQLPNAMRQHLDTDAIEWVAPVAAIVAFEIVYFRPPVWRSGSPIPSVFLVPSLYNRPPPFC